MFIDIHHHIIFGIDDGPKTSEQMGKMLKAAARDQVDIVIATPHASPGLYHFPYQCYLERLNFAEEWCSKENLPLTLYTGAEIFYTDATVRLLGEGKIPTLAETNNVLIEFSPKDPFEKLLKAVRKLGNAGFHPIFAHAERYDCLRQGDRLAMLHDQYCVTIQMNANTVLRKKHFFFKRWVDQAIENGWIDLIASDTHNIDDRKCCLTACYQALKEQYGEDIANRLMIDGSRVIFKLV